MRPQGVYALTWLFAAVLATAVGLSAISLVGDVLRGQGLLGEEVVAARAQASRAPAPRPSGPPVRRTVDFPGGTLTGQCTGGVAMLLSHAPAEGYVMGEVESGPDEDVDATFVGSTMAVTVEIYCNRGQPRVTYEVSPR